MALVPRGKIDGALLVPTTPVGEGVETKPCPGMKEGDSQDSDDGLLDGAAAEGDEVMEDEVESSFPPAPLLSSRDSKAEMSILAECT